MKYSEIASRYSKALFDLSDSENMQGREEILLKLSELEKAIPKFHQFLLNPLISEQEKKALLEKIIPDPLLIKFLLMLIDRGKWALLSAIGANYQKLSQTARGVVSATLITATNASPEIIQRFKEKVSSLHQKQIELTEHIQPNILGGAIFIIGNQIIDFSLQSRLNRMKRVLS